MLQPTILLRAFIIGTVLQVVLALLGHFIPWIADHVVLFGGMLISAIVGYFYAQEYDKGYAQGALGGAVAGGACAIIGACLSIVLYDASVQDLAFRTGVSMLTGAVGGPFGQIAANMR